MRLRIGTIVIVIILVITSLILTQMASVVTLARTNVSVIIFMRQAFAYAGSETTQRLAIGRAMLYKEATGELLPFDSYLNDQLSLPDLDHNSTVGKEGGRITSFLWRGLILLDQNDVSRALSVLRERPDSAVYFAGLGDELFAQGRYAEALTRYEQSQAIEDRVSLAELQMYTNLCHCDCLVAAQRVSWCKRVATVRQDMWGLVELGVLYVQLERYDDALSLFDEASKLEPESAVPHSWRGNAFFAVAKYQDAIREYSIAVRLAPENSWAHLGLAKAMRQTGDLAGARKELEMVVSLGESQTSSLALQDLSSLPDMLQR